MKTGDSDKHEVNSPDQCKGCPDGEMLVVWATGLETLDSSPCNEAYVCEHVTEERRDYCYEVWRKKFPSRAAALDAGKAALWRQVYRRHKTL
jgi:hypothetical protein